MDCISLDIQLFFFSRKGKMGSPQKEGLNLLVIGLWSRSFDCKCTLTVLDQKVGGKEGKIDFISAKKKIELMWIQWPSSFTTTHWALPALLSPVELCWDIRELYPSLQLSDVDSLTFCVKLAIRVEVKSHRNNYMSCLSRADENVY